MPVSLYSRNGAGWKGVAMLRANLKHPSPPGSVFLREVRLSKEMNYSIGIAFVTVG